MRFSQVLRMRPSMRTLVYQPIEINYRSTYSNNPTGLTGISHAPDAKDTLLRLYYETEQLLKEFPESSVYRQSVEGIIKSRKSIIAASPDDIPQIEKKINGGLIEEILIQAGEEYRLAQSLLKWKVWEDLEEKPPTGIWENPH
ncbi:uncharacterized protein V1516DRAFT_676301 [Lipomyces oligophaga]|uniref:uncharacterized protein n=1 Tax=Lipomyces oligophaga TaxID=45792 RepID=UPI0034CE625E